MRLTTNRKDAPEIGASLLRQLLYVLRLDGLRSHCRTGTEKHGTATGQAREYQIESCIAPLRCGHLFGLLVPVPVIVLRGEDECGDAMRDCLSRACHLSAGQGTWAK